MPLANRPGGGATFFLALEAALVRAHDDDRINELALLGLLKKLNVGLPVTWVDLAETFGVEAIYEITRQLRKGEV